MEKHIINLIEKYYAGQTSPEEESQLIQFFSKEEDLGNLEEYRAEFIQSDSWQTVEASEDFKARLLQQFSEPQKPKGSHLIINRNWLSIAAGVLLLITGFLLGRTSPNSSTSPNDELLALQTEVQSLRTMMIVSLFEQPRASDRIKAVRMAESLENPVEEAIGVLINAINEDPNTNVRLASIKALSAFRGVPEVQKALLSAISNQDSPIVQIELLRSIKKYNGQEKEPILLELLDQNDLDEQVKEYIQQILKSI